MRVLSDAELVLGLSRHLSAYQMRAGRAALGELEFAGWVFDMAFRLRGSTTSPARRVTAIGFDVGLSARSLKEVVGTMEALGWVQVQRDTAGAPVSVTETIPPPAALVTSSDAVFAALNFGSLEHSVLSILRATTMQPLLVEDALQVAADAGGDAVAAEDAVRYLDNARLVRRVTAADGRVVLYNPNVWTQGDSIAEAALRAADAHATSEVGITPR